MTTARTVESQITAFLDGEDSLEINNIIHSTAGAARFGYSGPLVGGVTVYAWTVSAIVEALGEDWLHEGWVEFQLRRPVYPGDEMTTRVEVASGEATFEMRKETGEVAVRGAAGLGVADFASEITQATDRLPAPTPANRPFITPALLPPDADLPAMAIDFSEQEAADYADVFARDPHPRGERLTAMRTPAGSATGPTNCSRTRGDTPRSTRPARFNTWRLRDRDSASSPADASPISISARDTNTRCSTSR